MILSRVLLVVATFIMLPALAQAQTDIRKVDFQNFTYKPYCFDNRDVAGEKPLILKVKNGEYKLDKPDETVYFEIDEIVYGDLNGDKRDEAVVRTLCNTGGTGQFSEGFVYTIKKGKPFLLTRIAGGDRGFGGLQSLKVKNKFLLVEENDGEANCCADYTLTTKYRWTGTKLVSVGKPIRRKIKVD